MIKAAGVYPPGETVGLIKVAVSKHRYTVHYSSSELHVLEPRSIAYIRYDVPPNMPVVSTVHNFTFLPVHASFLAASPSPLIVWIPHPYYVYSSKLPLMLLA